MLILMILFAKGILARTRETPYSQRRENSKLVSSIKTWSIHTVAIHVYVTDFFQFKIKTDLPLIAKQGTKGYLGEFNNIVSKIGDLRS